MQRRPQTPRPGSRGRSPRWRLIAVYAALLISGLWIFQSFTQSSNDISYSQFRDLVGKGRVVDVTITTSVIEGRYRQGNRVVEFTTNQLPVPDEQLVPELRKHKVKIESKLDNPITGILLTYILPFGLILGIWFFLMRRMGGRLPGSAVRTFAGQGLQPQGAQDELRGRCRSGRSRRRTP